MSVSIRYNHDTLFPAATLTHDRVFAPGSLQPDEPGREMTIKLSHVEREE